MRKMGICQAFLKNQSEMKSSGEKRGAQPKDYCLTCRLPVKLCKGSCTAEERKRNGG